MKIAGALLAGLLALAGLPRMVSPAIARSSSQENALNDSDRAWVQKYFPAALGEFFPIEHAEGDFIAVRAHREHVNDVPEYSIVLEDTQDPRALHATLREAQGASLFDQLAALHAKDPSKSYEDLKAALQVRVSNFPANQCPAVAAQYKAFENIQFVRPHDDDIIAEYPILYEIHESVGGGDSEVVEFTESRALPQWANTTHKALDACLASAGAK